MKEIDNDSSEQMADLESSARSVYAGKRILVTGAAGSIGSQLVKHLIRFAPLKIAAFDKDENALHELEQELRLRRAPLTVEPYVADIRDAARLEGICQAFAPQVIFHAAAYKHVPLMELHPCEAVLSNVIGTKNLLDVVVGFGAERFVFVSTDKAVNPVSVMGATKRIGEMLVSSAAQSDRVHAASVRFGNVFGSRGSVVPLFRQQIAEGGPVTVTHPDVVRYFMTTQHAINLILAAGCEAHGGEIYVAEMGRPRNIRELAREMILLSGLEPDRDIEIRIIGLRPGERLSEQLVARSERLGKTRFKGMSFIESPSVDQRALLHNISHLVQGSRSTDRHGIYATLEMMGLGFKRAPESSVVRLGQTSSFMATEGQGPVRSGAAEDEFREGGANLIPEKEGLPVQASAASVVRTHGSQKGVTLLELLMTIAILVILSSAVVGTVRFNVIREREWELRRDLRDMRTAIDRYKDLADKNLIRTEVGSEGYPPSLDVLVKGVDIGPSGPRIRFLRRVPADPMTKRTDWVFRSVQDDEDSPTWGGNNVFDVHSNSPAKGLDGTPYSTW